jgi:uncharacterized protein (TIGR02996 family)
MHDEQDFLQQIRERPHDEAIRLVFADWLEEAGDPRAEFLRVDAQLAQMDRADPAYEVRLFHWRDLRDGLPADWQLLLGRSVVENCGLKLLPCPQKWNDLDATPHDGVRRCWACERNVHYCQSMDELHAHARRGDCVAVDPRIPHLARDLLPLHDENLDMTLGVLVDEDPLVDEDAASEPPSSRLRSAAYRRMP